MRDFLVSSRSYSVTTKFKLSKCLKSEKVKIEDAIVRNFSQEFLEECYTLEKKENFKNRKEPNKTKKIKL